LKNRVMSFAAAALVATLALTGCASRELPSDPSIQRVADVTEIGVPVPADLFDRQQPYRIGPFDIISYSVFGIQGMSGELQVDAGGRISIPMVGAIDAAGRTTEELAAVVREGLRANYVRDPRVTFNLQRMQSQMVTVEGDVNQAGLYPIVNDMTLLRALASARGLNERARDENVMVLRTVEGRRYAALYNLRAIRQGAYPDPRIYGNDIVVVDRARNRTLFRDLLQTLPSVLTPLIILLQNNSN
jgi:polysaccharide biosynthesis/export protein